MQHPKNQNMYKILAALFLSFSPFNVSADIYANTFISGRSTVGQGSTNLMTLDVLIADMVSDSPSSVIGIYLAALTPDGKIFFHDGKKFVQFDGKAAAAYKFTTQEFLQGGYVRLDDFDVSALYGAQLYIGYGNTFQKMLDRTQFKAIATISTSLPPASKNVVAIENSIIYCAPPGSTKNGLYIAFTTNNRTNSTLSAVDYHMEITGNGHDVLENGGVIDGTKIFPSGLLPNKSQLTVQIDTPGDSTQDQNQYQTICASTDKNVSIRATAAYNLAGAKISGIIE